MPNPRVVAVVQARLGSSRLPGKVRMDICGKPMLRRVCERLATVTAIERVVVACAMESWDPTKTVAEAADWCMPMAPVEDVLARTYAAARFVGADHVVRVTSDCPLIDPSVVAQCIALHLANAKALAPGDDLYTSNVHPRSFPDGLDCEVLSIGLLNRMATTCTDPADREHVTLWLRRQNQLGVYYASLEREPAGQTNDHLTAFRWSVDGPDDLAFVRQVYQVMGCGVFSWRDVLSTMGIKAWRLREEATLV